MLNYFSKNEIEKQSRFSSYRDKIFRPVVLLLSKIGITPNQISFIGLFSCFCVLFVESWLIASFLIGFYILCDGIDGPLARHLNIQSNGGSVIDIFCDQMGVLIIAIAAINNGAEPVSILIFSCGYFIMILLVIVRNHLSEYPNFLIRPKYLFYGIYLYSIATHSTLEIFVFSSISSVILWYHVTDSIHVLYKKFDVA